MTAARLEKQEEMNGGPTTAATTTTTTNKEIDKYEQAKREAFPTKVFLQRNSLLTDLMALNHLQTVHNISIAIFVLLVMVTTVYYIAAPNQFWNDISLVTWGASQIKWFFIIWISLHISCIYGMFPAFTLWARVRSKFHKKFTDTMFLFAYINYLILAIVVPAYLLFVNNVPPITAFATLGEQLRLWMKTYSFVKESVPKVLNEDRQKDGKQDHHFRPNLRSFVYFLFVPTLIYRESYPIRTEKSIRWSFVFSNLLQMWCCIFITYCCFTRFTMQIFKKACLKEFLPSELALIYGGCMAVGSLKLLLMFYGVLHCWFNAFAEMLRFGDRQFYQDWWNSTTFSQYYRKWNGVVYDWLYAYIHADMHKLTGNRVLSMLIVFLTSAIVHEYAMALALGFFYPALCTVYSTVGVPLVFLTNKRSSKQWNIFFWFMMISGWGVLEFLYSFEWYARVNTPRLSDEFLDFFVPRTLSCKIIGSQPT